VERVARDRGGGVSPSPRRRRIPLKPVWLAEVRWQHQIAFPESAFRWGRVGTDFVAEWGDILVLRCDDRGTLLELWADERVSSSWLGKLQRGAAAAFVRSVRGELSWHAAAVGWGAGAVMLVGESGAGKSTVAHDLCEHHGAALLADDVAAVIVGGREVSVEPSEPVVWLAPASGPPDRRVPSKEPRATRAASARAPLAMCVFLEFEESTGIRSRRLGGTAGFQRLLDGVIRFVPSPEQWRRELDAIARIVEQSPLVELIRGRTTPAAATAEYVMMLRQHYEGERARAPRAGVRPEGD
jgi:hypothetical protein